MNVELTPDVNALIQQAIRSGRLHREEEAVQEALWLWAERERRAVDLRVNDQAKAQAAIDLIFKLREANFLPEGVTIKDLINEGRA